MIIARPLYEGKSRFQAADRKFVERRLGKAFHLKVKVIHFVIIIPSNLKRHFFAVFLPLISKRAARYLCTTIVPQVAESSACLLEILHSHGLDNTRLPPFLADPGPTTVSINGLLRNESVVDKRKRPMWIFGVVGRCDSEPHLGKRVYGSGQRTRRDQL